jgi:arylsulfatase
MPVITNLRQDPFERLSCVTYGETPTLNNSAPGYMMDFYAREFWRFVFVQEKVKELAMTAVEYPPMQDPASFNLEAVKKQVESMIKSHHGQ